MVLHRLDWLLETRSQPSWKPARPMRQEKVPDTRSEPARRKSGQSELHATDKESTAANKATLDSAQNQPRNRCKNLVSRSVRTQLRRSTPEQSTPDRPCQFSETMMPAQVLRRRQAGTDSE